MTEGLAQRMEQELGYPCTLVFTGGLGRFVAPLCRREAVYDEDPAAAWPVEALHR